MTVRSENHEVADPAAIRLAVRVRYFAGARAAAGIQEETVRLSGPSTAADLINAVLSLHDSDFANVVPACSFLLNGVAVRDHDVEVTDGSEFDVLPPFAGG